MIVYGRTILGLPSLTGSHAADAKTLGAFGLVWRAFTIPYHRINLGQTFWSAAITKHYHLEKGTHIEPDRPVRVGQ